MLRDGEHGLLGLLKAFLFLDFDVTLIMLDFINFCIER